MTASRSLVLGPDSLGAEDELRLPRPPGVLRRFWARHPRGTDILLACLAFLLGAPSLGARTMREDFPTGTMLVPPLVLCVIACVALVWRRRWPISVFVIAFAPIAFGMSDALTGPASVVAVYSIAVYRSSRSAWIVFGAGGFVLAATTTTRSLLVPGDWPNLLSVGLNFLIPLLIATLVGVNVGNRKRYLEAVIARSRQLLVERDQQARLAAAAERTRIAREMHDVVSHSLTVVVALAEGASATDDPERARDASRAVAATARDALTQMRVMLGVLRTDADDDAPRAPLLDTTVDDLIAGCRGAGYAVTSAVRGQPWTSTPHRLAVVRIVQEGLTNAMRYSSPETTIRVDTEYTDEGVTVTVENDRAQPGRSTGAGWGLNGLRERVTALGGDLTAGESAPGVWRLRAHLPKKETA